MPYAEDTFFHLAPWARVGLVAAALGMALVLVALLWPAMRRTGSVWLRILLALLGLWLFLWLSVQGFYAYFRVEIPGLPEQWVIAWPPPGPGRLVEILSFTGKVSIAEHARAALGWGLIAWAVWPMLRRLRARSRPR